MDGMHIHFRPPDLLYRETQLWINIFGINTRPYEDNKHLPVLEYEFRLGRAMYRDHMFYTETSYLALLGQVRVNVEQNRNDDVF